MPEQKDLHAIYPDLGNLSLMSDAETRSISAENFYGEKGAGAMATTGTGAKNLGKGWKISPCVNIGPNSTFQIADIQGPACIQSIWFTPTGVWRFSILRIYWDDEETPSVECPIGDFFGMGWGEYAPLISMPICVNPGSAFNSYWQMPFRKRCRMTLENIGDEEIKLYYQVNYVLIDVPDDAAYFHAQFRRTNPVPFKEPYTIADGIKGWGHYVGTYMAWQTNIAGWWGEGEIKFYMDGDEWPTVCGTGTEDYFLGAWGYNVDKVQTGYTTPFAGMHQVIRPDGTYKANTRFGLYRWHIMDPIRFEKDLRVTMQALGWQGHDYKRFRPLQDDLASVAYWYQTEPHAPFPNLPERDYLEVK